MDATSAEAVAGAPASTLSASEVKAVPSVPEQAKIDSTPAQAASAPGKADAAIHDGGEKPTNTAATADDKPAAAATAAAAPDTTKSKTDAADEKPAAAAASTDASAAASTSGTPFESLAKQLPAIIKEIGHDEMWGVKLAGASTTEPSVPVSIVIQKFLNANEGDLTKAIEQLKAALKFRKEKKPLELLDKTYSKAKFGELGAITVYPVKGSAVPEVFTWNLYGNVKDRMDEVFVPLEE
jgi:phosphatidylinositol transfer protein SFH5